MKENNKKVGAIGEKIAKEYLQKEGYKILETNFYCRFGEIDIVAKNGDEIVFVEVKTRKQIRYGNGAESVNYYKKNHIYKVAEFYTYIYQLYENPISFDVIEVYLFDDQETRVAHMKSAIIENPYKTFLNRG